MTKKDRPWFTDEQWAQLKSTQYTKTPIVEHIASNIEVPDRYEVVKQFPTYVKNASVTIWDPDIIADKRNIVARIVVEFDVTVWWFDEEFKNRTRFEYSDPAFPDNLIEFVNKRIKDYGQD